MNRLAALLLLAGISWAAIPRRRPVAVEAVEPITTFDGVALLMMPTLSNTVH